MLVVVSEGHRSTTHSMRSRRRDKPQSEILEAVLEAMMTEVNVAYEAGDLLRLLGLQLDLERVDPAEIEALAEERPRHYDRRADQAAAMELDDAWRWNYRRMRRSHRPR